MNNKAKLITIIIVAVIVVPIIFQTAKKFYLGTMMQKMMGMPTKVVMATVESKPIKDEADFVGRIETTTEVKVVSRVNGWLQKQFYKDGDIVKKGQLLFQIEPDEYALAVKNAEAALRQVQASYEHSAVELQRAQKLVKGDYVSRSYYDNAFARHAADKASVDAAKASLATAKLNLSYTKIYAPCDGKMGEGLIDEGNYVTAQTGELAKLVAINPIYVSFTLKESDLNRFRASEETNNMDADVSIKLSDGTVYRETGKVDFINNEIDKDLGTILVRSTFSNNEGKLIPNDFVRVILTSRSEKDVLLIPQSAVMESVNGKYVWVADENGFAKQQDIEVAGTYQDKWIVKDGLKAGDKVIGTNLQSMRQGMKVQETELTEEEKAKKIQAKKDALKYSMTDKPNRKDKAE